MELTINSEIRYYQGVGDIANLSLSGPIDEKSVRVFEAAILEFYRKGVVKLILDLSDAKYLSSEGLAVIIAIAHKVSLVGGGIRLTNVAEKFKVLFDMLGLENSILILSSYEEAIESFGGKLI